MDVHVDQARGNDESTRVDLLDCGFLIADCGLLSDAPVRNYEIANFIAIIRRIDDPSIANDGRAHVAIPPHKYSTAMRTARPLVT